MGVYIKGMEMPKSCYECSLCYDLYRCRPLGVNYYDRPNINPANERLPNCPLVPVPPHGRLIDADAMIRNIQKSLTPSWYIKERNADMVKFLSLEDTIIPAEEGET